VDDNDAGLGTEPTPQRGSIVLIAAGFIVIAVAIFIAQNSETIPVQFLVFQGSVPLWLLIVVAMVLGATLGWVIGLVRRRRKQTVDE
jgi:uncharacterized integral membrane protein